MSHKCHIGGCEVKTERKLLFCLKHWRMVPEDMKKEVWEHYSVGQCDGRKIKREWVLAAQAARLYVEEKIRHQPEGTKESE